MKILSVLDISLDGGSHGCEEFIVECGVEGYIDDYSIWNEIVGQWVVEGVILGSLDLE